MEFLNTSVAVVPCFDEQVLVFCCTSNIALSVKEEVLTMPLGYPQLRRFVLHEAPQGPCNLNLLPDVLPEEAAGTGVCF